MIVRSCVLSFGCQFVGLIACVVYRVCDRLLVVFVIVDFIPLHSIVSSSLA